MPDTDSRDLLDSAVLSRLSRLTVQARMPMLGSVSGIHRSATRGSSVEFAEYRKYVPGDDTRHVDWRVFARSDRFYMKEFEADTNLRCHIAVDCSGSMGFAGAHGVRFRYATRLAATLAHLLMYQGDAVGLLCFSDKVVRDIPPRDSPSHLKAILDALAEVEPAGRTDVVRTMHALAEKARQRALVILISDLLADVPALLDCFQHMRFRRHDLAVFHLLDPQETDFEFDRPIRFVDMEDGFHMITDPSVVKGAYRRALDAYLRSMASGCGEFGVDYRVVFAHQDYEQALAAFLLKRKNRASARV